MNNELRELTKDEALDLLRRAVAEKGEDFVYVDLEGTTAGTTDDNGLVTSMCKYFDAEAVPSCIIGHVFAYAGAAADDVLEDAGVIGQRSEGDDFVVDGFWYTPETAGVMLAAQRAQDGGLTWGQALARAEEVAEDLQDIFR